ncbi:MAG: 50S ribosomal protein L11 methyltransferase [Pseudomonadota bacterium]
MVWRQFVMELAGLDPELVERTLDEQGALAITLSDAGDAPVLEPKPGETPLWTQTRVTALFDEDRDMAAVTAALRTAIAPQPLPVVRLEDLQDRVWEREWLQDFKPMRFGDRLWVAPHHEAVDAEDAVVVRLDPGLAFGTGTHPTTALCLEWLDGARLEGATLLDYGCGSGILAIAALLLGAAEATAVDIDSQAITASRNNAASNGVLSRMRFETEVDVNYDIVVANILAQPLIENAIPITERLRPGGKLALSGVLADQADDVCAAFAHRVTFAPHRYRGDWALLAGTRN